ncbi:MAG: glycoside hydrolase family 172 protein [Phycisphaerales bacterium]
MSRAPVRLRVLAALACATAVGCAGTHDVDRSRGASPFDDLATVRDARSRRVSSASTDPGSNSDNRWVKPGETLTIADLRGPGVIRHIWVTFAEAAPSWLAKEGAADPSEIVLRMYWDGADEPAVEAPFGDFFAAGFGARASVDSMPIEVQGGDAYNCYWAMPFRSSARITLTNESDRPLAGLYYQIDWAEERVPSDAAYFCAQYRQEFPTQLGRDYLIADIASTGGGQYVGTVLSVRSRSPEWFGEGDEKFFVDGESTPSIWGTGTEDYVSNAWGVEKGCFPYFGVPILVGDLGEVDMRSTMYRWHVPDPVRFRSTLRLEIEHAGWMSADETTTGKTEGFVEREDDFSSVAFWYQRGYPKRFATLPSAKERKLPSIDRVFDGATLKAQSKSQGGSLSLQAGGPWTGQGQLFFRNDAGTGAWFDVTFDVANDETRRFVLALTHSYDFGVYSFTLDGRTLGEPIDCYSPDVDVREHALGNVTLAPGPHTLRVECVGKNAASRGHSVGLDAVRLRERWNKQRTPIKKTQ